MGRARFPSKRLLRASPIPVWEYSVGAPLKPITARIPGMAPDHRQGCPLGG
jgi:hypothetical protein